MSTIDLDELYKFLGDDYKQNLAMQGYEEKYCDRMSKQRSAIEEDFRTDPKTTNGTKVFVSSNPRNIINALEEKIHNCEVYLKTLLERSEDER